MRKLALEGELDIHREREKLAKAARDAAVGEEVLRRKESGRLHQDVEATYERMLRENNVAPKGTKRVCLVGSDGERKGEHLVVLPERTVLFIDGEAIVDNDLAADLKKEGIVIDA